jgi:hypothetical protein
MEVSLAEARALLARARRQVEQGESPSKAKVEKRTASAEALTFGGWAEAYFKHKADPKSGAEKLADSTLAMRRSVYDRAIAGKLSKLKLGEVTPQRLKHLCDEVKKKRALEMNFSGRLAPFQSVPATLQPCGKRSTIIAPSTAYGDNDEKATGLRCGAEVA